MLQDDEIEQDSDDRKRKKQYGGGVWLLQAHHAKHQQLKHYCRDNHPTKTRRKLMQLSAAIIWAKFTFLRIFSAC